MTSICSINPNRSCVNLNVCGGYGHQYMYMFYLAEGSKLCIPVMKKRTMKAHTRLDLNTSSRIWEYCRGNTHIHTQKSKDKNSSSHDDHNDNMKAMLTT